MDGHKRREPDDKDLAHLEAQAEELERRLRQVQAIIGRVKGKTDKPDRPKK